MRWLEGGRTMQMSGGSRSVSRAFPPLAIWFQLVRPALLSTVLFSMAIGALTAPERPSWWLLVHALLGTALVIAGATAMNQLAERRHDAAMKRTASRPLPAGLVTGGQVAVFAALSSLGGLGYLALLVPPLVTFLAAVSWVIYVMIYTPLKAVTLWHIPAGAVSGAMPVLIGAATARAAGSPAALALFAVVFFWQFPHTAAIGWIYREQYARCRMKVAAVVDPSGRTAGRLAVGGAAGMLLASLVPATWSAPGWTYVAIAVTIGLAHLWLAARFLREPGDTNARALFRVSMLHLPLLLVMWLLL